MAGPGALEKELIAKALPGARFEETGIVVEGPIAIPHIEGDDFTVALVGPVAVKSIEDLELHIDGRPHLALLVGLGETDATIWPVTVLALFDLRGNRLVDVADVGMDRLVSFGWPASVPVARDEELLLISNRHGNSSQFHEATTLIDLVGGELSMVDTIFTLSDQSCAGSRTQSLEFIPEGGGLTVKVTDRYEPPLEPCADAEPLAIGERIYRATYRQDASGQWQVEGDGWAELDALNAERY